MSGRLAAWHFRSENARAACAERATFAKYLRTFGRPESDIHSAEIIFGELIGNVLQHAPGPVRLRVDWTADRRARLTIWDTGAPFEIRRPLPNDSVEHGRGLHIVGLLAHQFDVRRGARGSIVTAVLPVLAA